MKFGNRVVSTILLAMVMSLPMIVVTPSAAAQQATAATPTVLVTGANRGIGLELARQYAARGYNVIATARKPGEAAALNDIARASANVSIVTLDLAKPETIDALAASLAGRPVDVLIHNAGVSGGVPAQMLGRMRYDVFREVLEVNAVGPMKLTELLLANLKGSTQKKVILIGTSEASFGQINAGRLYWYRASKAAAHMLMLNLAFEVKSRGIAVGVINPGPVDTDLMKGVRMPLQPPAEAVGKIIGIIDRMTLENTGKFWNYSGGEVPW
jgi:NAD(P)-dependent dehydrogenase (short-subunit alcohol dehydrogenase family)